MQTTTNNAPAAHLSMTERAVAIRAELKAAGWNARKVSIRCANSTLRATIRCASVPMTPVKAIVERFGSVSRCAYSGEILLGGNTYTSIEYTHEAIGELVERIDAVLATVEGTPGNVVLVEGFEAWASTGDPDTWNANRGEDFTAGVADIHCWGRKFCARQIAIASLDVVPELDEAPAAELDEAPTFYATGEGYGFAPSYGYGVAPVAPRGGLRLVYSA